MSVKSGFIRKLISKLRRLFGGATAKSRSGIKDQGPREHGVFAI